MKILFTGILLFIALKAASFDTENVHTLDTGVTERRLNLDDIKTALWTLISGNFVTPEGATKPIKSGDCATISKPEELFVCTPTSNLCIDFAGCTDVAKCTFTLHRKMHNFRIHLESIWDQSQKKFNPNFSIGKYLHDFCNEGNEAETNPTATNEDKQKASQERIVKTIQAAINSFSTTPNVEGEYIEMKSDIIEGMLDINVKFAEDPKTSKIGPYPEAAEKANLKGWIRVKDGSEIHVKHVHTIPIYFWVTFGPENIPQLTIKSVYFETELVYSSVDDAALVSFTETSVSEAIDRYVRLTTFIHSNTGTSGNDETVKHKLSCENVFDSFQKFKDLIENKFDFKPIAVNPVNVLESDPVKYPHLIIAYPNKTGDNQPSQHQFVVGCHSIQADAAPSLNTIRVLFGKLNNEKTIMMKQEDFLEESLYHMKSFLNVFRNDAVSIIKRDCSISLIKKVIKKPQSDIKQEEKINQP